MARTTGKSNCRRSMRWSVYPTALAPSLRVQYAVLMCHAGKDCHLFFQVGRFIEFYGSHRLVGLYLRRDGM